MGRLVEDWGWKEIGREKGRILKERRTEEEGEQRKEGHNRWMKETSSVILHFFSSSRRSPRDVSCRYGSIEYIA